MENNKTLLLFPDGVGIRNYLYSDVFRGKEKELVLFHAFDKQTVAAVQKITGIQEELPIPTYKETAKEKLYRELICLVRLQYNAKKVGNRSILSNWKKEHKSFKNKIFYKAIEGLASTITSYAQILKLEIKYQKIIRNTLYYQEVIAILKKIQPAQIFCSHQRGIACAPIFAAAQDLGIKTTTVIYSWDNLPKARMALQADAYLVWSNHMKIEMNTYYPEIQDQKIIVSGTPQFECYKQSENIIPKGVFFQRYNLDLAKKIICFSGDDAKTSPDDPQYLADLAEELIKNKTTDIYQILLRRCPVDVSGRFDAVVSKYSDLIKEAPPLWNFTPNSSWTTIYPLPEDVQLLVSTAFYCEVVVNLGSTMAFDFAMFQKPCIYINYDQVQKVNPNWSVNTIYQFQHFRSMQDKNAVIWWTQKEQITALLQETVYNPAMANWTQLILGNYLKASEKITNILNN